MTARVLKIETRESFNEAVEEAACVLRAGEVVAVPTETVYGLAANALDPAAVQKIYQVKGRPAINPIIVHVSSLEMAQRCAGTFPERAAKLARRFWPGPLTLVLEKSNEIPAIVTAEGETVGIRWPFHPFMRAVIRRCEFPLAAPSANRSNELSPTSAEHVISSLGDRIPLIVDAGASNVGIESTVVDLTVSPPRILRPGMIPRAELEATLKCTFAESVMGSETLKSPGQLKRHYSPHARLVIGTWRNDAEVLSIAQRYSVSPGAVHVLAYDIIPRSDSFGRIAIFPEDPEAYARALYAELHRCDEMGASLIIIEQVPATGAWTAIRDRLTRASVEPEKP